MGHPRPVVQGMEPMEDMEPAAGIPGVGDHAEGVCTGGDHDPARVFLHTAGKTAGVAGEEKAHPLALPGVKVHGLGAHHHDIRVTHLPGDVLGQIQAVARAGKAVDPVFRHEVCLLIVYINNLS